MPHASCGSAFLWKASSNGRRIVSHCALRRRQADGQAAQTSSNTLELLWLVKGIVASQASTKMSGPRGLHLYAALSPNGRGLWSEGC